jgi:hypothetical protein
MYRRDDGMTTAEYAVGLIAAVAFAGILYKVVTSGRCSPRSRRSSSAPSRRDEQRRDGGMATAELAVVLPTLVLVIVAGLTMVSVVLARSGVWTPHGSSSSGGPRGVTGRGALGRRPGRTPRRHVSGREHVRAGAGPRVRSCGSGRRAAARRSTCPPGGGRSASRSRPVCRDRGSVTIWAQRSPAWYGSDHRRPFSRGTAVAGGTEPKRLRTWLRWLRRSRSRRRGQRGAVELGSRSTTARSLRSCEVVGDEVEVVVSRRVRLGGSARSPR